MNELDFKNKAVLVVGGSSGIGNGIAHAFAERDAAVHVWGTRATAQDYDGVEGSDLNGLAYACVDVADRAQIAAAEGPPALDVLVLCQGTVRSIGGGEFEPEGWDRVMAVNLDSLMACAAKFHDQLAARNGVIIIVSSVSGYTSNRGNPAYAASKAGAVSLTKTLGEAWARDGIREVGLAPGLVDTKLTKVTTENPQRREGALRAIPLGRMGTPADMAGAALFLASPLAAYVVGQTLIVDERPEPMTANPRSVAGSTVFITGAASGMGRATAEVFAAEGAHVALADIAAESVREVADDLVHRGFSAEAWTLDVSDPAAILTVIGEVAQRFGGLDMVVNNAGISAFSPIDSEGYEKVWTHAFDILITAQQRIIRAALPHLRKSAHPRIVNIASTEALGATSPRQPLRRRQGHGHRPELARWRSSSRSGRDHRQLHLPRAHPDRHDRGDFGGRQGDVRAAAHGASPLRPARRGGAHHAQPLPAGGLLHHRRDDPRGRWPDGAERLIAAAQPGGRRRLHPPGVSSGWRWIQFGALVGEPLPGRRHFGELVTLRALCTPDASWRHSIACCRYSEAFFTHLLRRKPQHRTTTPAAEDGSIALGLARPFPRDLDRRQMTAS